LPLRRAADAAHPGRLDPDRLPPAPPGGNGRARGLRRRLPPLRRRDRSRLPGEAGRLGTLVRARGDRDPSPPGRYRSPLPDTPDALALAEHPSLRAQASRAAQVPLAVRALSVIGACVALAALALTAGSARP